MSFSRGSSRPRDQTYVSCIDRWILYHWAIWEALSLLYCILKCPISLFLFSFFCPAPSSPRLAPHPPPASGKAWGQPCCQYITIRLHLVGLQTGWLCKVLSAVEDSAWILELSITQSTAGNERAQPLLSLRGGRECGGFGEIDGPNVSRSRPRTEFIHPDPGLVMCASPWVSHLAQSSEKRQKVCPLASWDILSFFL